MRFLLFLMLYAAALALGFIGRGRYDAWMYSKTHMQQRMRVFAAQVFNDPDPVGITDYLPPSTTDQLALSPSATEAWLQQAADLAAEEDGEVVDSALDEEAAAAEASEPEDAEELGTGDVPAASR